MADASNYLKQAVADYFFRPSAAAPVRPTSFTMSLWSAVTNAAAGTGTEFTTGTAPGYLRSAITWGAITIPGGVLPTNFTCVFPTATGLWPSANFYGIHDQAGNLLHALKALTSAPVIVPSGSHAEATAGTLTVTIG